MVFYWDPLHSARERYLNETLFHVIKMSCWLLGVGGLRKSGLQMRLNYVLPYLIRSRSLLLLQVIEHAFLSLRLSTCILFTSSAATQYAAQFVLAFEIETTSSPPGDDVVVRRDHIDEQPLLKCIMRKIKRILQAAATEFLRLHEY